MHRPLLCLIVLCCCASARAATFVVTTNADAGAGSLRQAVADANNTPGADTISFGPGLSGQTILLSQADPASVADTPAGTPANQITAFGPTALLVTSDITVLGLGGNNGVTIARDTNNAANLRLFGIAGTGSLTLRRLTLRDGVAQGGEGGSAGVGGGGAAGLGGAVFNNGGTLTLDSSTLAGNRAEGGAGGAGGRGGAPAAGGGLGNDVVGLGPGGDPNGGGDGQNGGFGGGGGRAIPPARGGNGGFGGGGGASRGNGGFGGGGSATGVSGFGGGGVNESTGDAGGGAGLGGAVFNNGGTLVVMNSTLHGNVARGTEGPRNPPGGGFGGAIFSRNGFVSIDSSTFSDNATNSSFTLREAGRAGALYLLGDGGTLTYSITNSILANTLDSRGGVLDGNGQPIPPPDAYLYTINGGSLSDGGSGFNLVEINGGGANALPGALVSADPKLGPPQSNGGPTQSLALQSGSPAINAGSNDLIAADTGDADNDGNTSELTPFDGRGPGFPRVQADTVDAGAFEFNSFSESLIVTTLADEGNGTSDPAFGSGTSLREAIIFANSTASDDSITFAPATFAAPRKMITLSGGELTLGNNGALNITAPPAGVVVSGNNASRIFLVNFGARASLTGLTISGGNTGTFNGGGISNLGNLLLDACTLSSNSAAAGGAIFSDTTLSGVTLTLRNCTLSGNTASIQGGALHNNDGLTVIESSTIAGNTAPAGKGGGVASFGDTATRTETRNSIISGNASTDVDFVTSASNNSFQSNGFNLIGDGNATGDFNQPGDVTGNSDPGLSALAAHGGPTFTRALLLGSPAINTGGPSGLAQDQRGLARLFGAAVDKGAYELQPESYAFWAGYTFPPGTPAALTAFNADPDRDGIPNGLEQATGRNPLNPNAPGSLVLSQIQGTNLVLQFERSITVDPAKVFVEQSLNLQTWITPGITYQNLGPSSATTELIQALIPINNEPKKFGRLRYTP